MTYKNEELLKDNYIKYNNKFEQSLKHLPYTMTTAEGIGLIFGVLESHNLNLNTLLTTVLILSSYVAGGVITITPAVLKYYNLKIIKEKIIKYYENNNDFETDEELKNIYLHLREKNKIKFLK